MEVIMNKIVYLLIFISIPIMSMRKSHISQQASSSNQSWRPKKKIQLKDQHHGMLDLFIAMGNFESKINTIINSAKNFAQANQEIEIQLNQSTLPQDFKDEVKCEALKKLNEKITESYSKKI
jgi:hypothetical protein